MIMNLVDAIATCVWVTLGIAVEQNPLMAHLIGFSPSVFIIIKTLLVIACTYFLWVCRYVNYSRVLIIPALVLYAYVCSIHVIEFLKIIIGKIL